MGGYGSSDSGGWIYHHEESDSAVGWSREGNAMVEGRVRSIGVLGHPYLCRTPHPKFGSLPSLRRLFRGRDIYALWVPACLVLCLLRKGPRSLSLLLDRQACLQKFWLYSSVGTAKQVLSPAFKGSWARWVEICSSCALLTRTILCHQLCTGCYKSWVSCRFLASNSNWLPAHDLAEHFDWQPCKCCCSFSIWVSEISGLVIYLSSSRNLIKHSYIPENQKVFCNLCNFWSSTCWDLSWHSWCC